MKQSDLWSEIAAVIGSGFTIQRKIPVSGGDINAAFCIEGGNRAYFVKLNSADRLDMFEAEFEGLSEMISTNTVHTPSPIATGTTNESSFLVLEMLDLRSSSAKSDGILGEQLAAMHKHVRPDFGWHRDNTIGSTPQPNARCENWVLFWSQNRLRFQLDRAALNGCSSALLEMGASLCEQIDRFFKGCQPAASLLHGDLWSGNAAADPSGNPVLFDPACYFGDRECDLAMTELFGGFSPDFYAGYNAIWPLDPGYSVRKSLYNLYHILNHFNLFGAAYQARAESMIRGLLAELG